MRGAQLAMKAAAVCFGGLVFATGARGQTQSAAGADGQQCVCPERWIDSATGDPVETIPRSAVYGGTTPSGRAAPQLGYDGSDPNHAHNPRTGQSFVRLPSGCWIDSATGAPVGTIPRGAVYAGQTPSGHAASQLGYDGSDPDHAHNPNTGRNFVRIPCPEPESATRPVPRVAPRSPRPLQTSGSQTGPYIGIGGHYFFEPGTQLALVGGLAGYRLTPNIGLELQVDVGITRERFDNGSTFRSSTGISWSAMPYVVGYLPVGPAAELFARGGYGAYRFHQTSTVFSGATSTSSSSSNTVGTAALGGGAQIHLGGFNAIRADYQHLFFNNGSHADEVGISLVHSFRGR